MHKHLAGQRALITGASSGIGQATALALAAAGVHVALVSRRQDPLMAVAAEAQQLGVEAKAYPLDLAQVEQIAPHLQSLAQDFGGIDILINNAGIGYTANLLDTPLQDWQQVINLNLTSVFACTQALLPELRRNRRGAIVNVVSIGGRQAFPGWGAYCASKFGVMGFSKALAAEERTHGIRVIALCPGSVNTPLWDTETVHADFERSAMLTPEVVARSILDTLSLPPEAVIEELVLMPAGGAF
ncbi:SDR family oxidoreductase [Leptolyngbya sp. FACHB-261]|uniref:SDR family oxidoreductase n=1 Tax=Leptolyngbya sp. FACHB-261 TaxID=2692806 RepID=UPI0016843847|nr:SDR family oxidoreductase [Leptolyngbya sp. FACHB-261]MBD2103774.1 SDR family oxidoreductase [Leptolyngbya sp. FACHB-261]